MSDLANLIYDKSGWPELMPALLTMLRSNQHLQVGPTVTEMLGPVLHSAQGPGGPSPDRDTAMACRC